MYNFNRSQKSPFLTESQQKWIDLQRIIVEMKPKLGYMIPPNNRIRKIMFSLVNYKFFDGFIFIIIITNSIVMMIPYEGASKEFINSLNLLTQIFAIIFSFECFFKFVGFGYKQYFSINWNILDFFVVIFSSLDFIFYFFLSNINLLSQGDKIIRSIRVFRVLRILKLVKKFNGLQKLVQTLFFSIPKILNILALVLLLFFIYTILGCLLFKNVKPIDILDDYVNFKNFLFGIMTLFKISTSDQWSLIMWDVMQELSFFFSFILF